jgi:hypothetical protein
MIKGPNVLLMGDSGVGKTYSLRTLIPKGITPFIVFTEPERAVLADIPCPKLHWMYVRPGVATWSDLSSALNVVNKLSNDAQQKQPGVDKHKHNQILNLVDALGNFKCDRCGEKFGDVSAWDNDRAIVLDGLSGVNDLAKANAVGGKMVLTQPDWGVSMQSESTLIQMLCNIPGAMFVLIAHVAMERDEITGRIMKMPSALGRKVAPDLPRHFSDVILAVREGDAFRWTTASLDAVSAARNIPVSDKLAPDFSLLIDTWRAKTKNAPK